MNPRLLAPLCCALAYLIGAIPFAYVITYLVKGIDIRTVGSGNVGATNVGRVLGFRYFVIVFLLDFAKGYFPTLLIPMVAKHYGYPTTDLSVQVALAAILGHNFPVYLKFRGGKGVATSIGALFALDWIASTCTVAAFIVILLITRIVSLSSLLSGCVFVAAYFLRQHAPWRRDHIALSLLSIGLLVLLTFRHRGNLVRLWLGTEPRVRLRRGHGPPRAGRAAVLGLLGLAAIGGAAVLLANANRPTTIDCGPFTLVATARVETGQQRAERVAFADEGRLLAVTCPRYGKVVLYRVLDASRLELLRTIDVDGRAVAVWPAKDRLDLLIRPAGDARHVEEAWWQAIDFRGMWLGPRVRVGFDPDDMATSADGRFAFVLTSGRAEGESNRPLPALTTFDLGDGRNPPRPVARLEFDRPGDDPDRLFLSATGRRAVVTLLGTDQVATIDLADPARPRLFARTPLAAGRGPRVDDMGKDFLFMPCSGLRDAVVVTAPGEVRGEPSRDRWIVRILEPESALEVLPAVGGRSVGRLPLRGAGNLGAIRPVGLAYSPGRGLLAVANRQGGSVYVVALRPSP
ncbi:MAG TPA: glycerol-3-phosphate 1-O-acyltransferase PlsY [Isosphaeraceae bacterium]|jgi:glycerol-3-phosphate acyltransferase PlsY|nr:glycerol-3-phosphate 1-O-acyltransferase PlsY [Isosphaeraceae bacterium]